MKKRLEEVVIPKENAIFFLDRHGFWHHKEQGKFEHRKIIQYFHSCIRKDEKGYHLRQRLGLRIEKVYFHHEDTALFVFDVIRGNEVILGLNTGKRVRLRPRKLFANEESLYMALGKERVKFTDRSLIRISDLLDLEGDEYFITVKGRRYRIRPLQEESA